MSGQNTGNDAYITCIPDTTTVGEEAWKERAKGQDRFVVLSESATTADDLGVDFGTGGSTVGRLIAVTGSGSKLRATIEARGLKGKAKGSETGAFDAADFGNFAVMNANGELAVSGSATEGNIVVVSGTKDNPKVAWSFPHMK